MRGARGGGGMVKQQEVKEGRKVHVRSTKRRRRGLIIAIGVSY